MRAAQLAQVRVLDMLPDQLIHHVRGNVCEKVGAEKGEAHTQG